LIYEILPTASIVGWFEVSGVLVHKSDEWTEKTDWCIARQEDLQLTREEILNYLGQKPGYGIVIWQPKRITLILLLKMREVGILPPQGYRYLSEEDINRLGVKFND
jgi:predicted transcriptional regulator